MRVFDQGHSPYAATTQDDVARVAEVSRSLVSLALSNSPKVAKETRERIQRIAEELGYTPNFSATSLRNQSSDLLGIVMPNLKNPYYEHLIGAIQDISDQLQLAPMITTTANRADREITMYRRFRGIPALGVIGFSPTLDTEQLNSLAKVQPLVVVGQHRCSSQIDHVALDEDAAAAMIVRHLQIQGWQRIIYLADSRFTADGGVAGRLQALRKACGQRDVWFEAGEVSNFSTLTIAKHDAIIAHNDLIAVGVPALLRGQNLRVGRDIALVSYDNTYLVSGSDAFITSVEQHPVEQAKLAIDFLLTRVKQPDHSIQVKLCEPELIIRRSSLRQ